MTEETKLKTLTMKSVGVTIPLGGGEFIGKAVLAVHGLVDGYFMKNTTYGESVALQGEFNALNPLTGEVFMANVAYLPADFAEVIRTKLDNRERNSEQVEFSAQISVVASEKAARGYTFVAEPIQTAEVYDRRRAILAELQKKAAALPGAGSMKAIAAPKKGDSKNKAA